MRGAAGTQAASPPGNDDTLLPQTFGGWHLPGTQERGIGKNSIYLKIGFLLSFFNTLPFKEAIGQVAKEKSLFSSFSVNQISCR